MASAVDSRLAYARLSAVATASRLPTANRGSNNSYTMSWDTTFVIAGHLTRQRFDIHGEPVFPQDGAKKNRQVVGRTLGRFPPAWAHSSLLSNILSISRSRSLPLGFIF